MYWARAALLSGLLLATAAAEGNDFNIASYPSFNESKWIAARVQADAWITKMTLTEKSSLVTGIISGFCIENIPPIKRIGFEGLCLQDGPSGLRLADLASVFPAGVTTAATWDRDLMYQRGKAMGMEFRGKGAHVMLGPAAGPLGRSPWCGRNWESFSPDPYLTGVSMDLTIRAVQETGVQATAKHFIANEQETQRKPTLINDKLVDAVSANVDDRTLHELYLWPFADAIHAGVAAVMCAYNRVNGTYSCENSKLLNDILKKELGFQGYVMSDFFATPSGVKSIEAGLDMNQPGPSSLTDVTKTHWGKNIVDAVKNGTLSETRVNDMARRVLTPYFYLGQNQGYPTLDPSSPYVLNATYGLRSPVRETPAGRDVRANHGSLIRKIAAAGTVLLKNDNAVLPLKLPANIGVFGNDAADVSAGLLYPESGFDIGTLTIGGGSGTGRHSYIVPPLEAIKARARRTGAQVQYILDNTVISAGHFHSIYPWPDICLVFLKSWQSEGFDRTTLEADHNSSLVVDNVASICPGKTVVITHSGAPLTMPWASNPNVSAILAAHYPGQESGNSIVDILFGDVNPSGKLPYTIARDAGDYSTPIVNITGSDATNPEAWQSDFNEGLFIDYRHFDAKNITPLYEFGYGLSYTTFDLASEMSIKSYASQKITPYPPAVDPKTIAPGGDPDLWKNLIKCSSTVANTGPVAGEAVVQLYVTLPHESVPQGTPDRVLRGFDKVSLNPGEHRSVSFYLTRRDLSYWDVGSQGWRLPEGEITLSLGFSSRDFKSHGSVTLLKS